MKKINKKGFTLIELLVVIAIIGLLSTLAVVALNNARAKSRDAKRVADVKQMQTAMELYFNDCNQYPVLGAPGGPLVTTMNNGCGTTGVTLGTFLNVIPAAATPADGTCSTDQNLYTYQSRDADGSDCAADACASYTISYCLGSQTGGLLPGPKTANPGGM